MTGNIHITDSYRVSKQDFDYILNGREQLAYEQGVQKEIVVFRNRTRFSMKAEWAAHNALYGLHIARKRTKDVDLDYPQKWYMKALYTIGGILVWLFIK